jgi:hypothetical protein
MKAVSDIETLPKNIYETVISPSYSLDIQSFLRNENITDATLREYFERKLNSVAFGELSVANFVTEFSNLFEIQTEDESNPLFAFIFEIFNEDAVLELSQYDVNITKDSARLLFEPYRDMHKNISIEEKEEITIARKPEIVQSRLLQVLEGFNLHVDEKGVVAHEVERYLKGDILAKDLVPHLTAMLDKPLSEIHAIVTALNIKIFKPIQKQIAEEGTLDISYDNDESLEKFLVHKKNALNSNQNNSPSYTKKVDFATISFLPKKITKDISQQEKDSIVSNLKVQGGTPNGTSLFSQETPKNTFTLSEPSARSEDIDVMPKAKKETYTIDPYRESF